MTNVNPAEDERLNVPLQGSIYERPHLLRSDPGRLTLRRPSDFDIDNIGAHRRSIKLKLEMEDQSISKSMGGGSSRRRGPVRLHSTKKEEPSATTVEEKQPEAKQQQQEKQPKEPKISFQVDDNDDIVEVVHEYPFEPDMMHQEIWWTDDELDKLLTEAMLVADHFTRERKDWQDTIVGMLKQCKASNSSASKLKASELDFVVNSDARGLELYIHPIFQKSRVKAIQSVVAIQKQIAAREVEKGPDPEFRINALKNKSMKLTQPARVMAKTLAAGDARAAKQAADDKEEEEDEQGTATSRSEGETDEDSS